MSNEVAPSSSLSAAEQMAIIERERETEKARQTALLENAAKAEEERKLLQKTVYDSSNPSPIFVTCMVIGTLLIMYIIYVVFLKPCMSGIWIDTAGNQWYIDHSVVKNIFTVYVDDNYGGTGYIYDNYLQFGDLVGVWNYSDQIFFTDGFELNRLR